MLCKLLAATKIAGNPGSLFHEPSIEAWLEDYGLEDAVHATREQALEAIFAAAIAQGKGDSEIFGLRLQRGSFKFFMEQLELLKPGKARDVDRIEAAFGPTLFIFLLREDRLDQAISRLRAEQTGLWHLRADGTELERMAPRREEGYDPNAIRTHMEELSNFNTAWRRWFDEQSIRPLKFSYETLSSRPEAVLAEILAALGLDSSLAKTVPPQTAKLADETNRDWRSRFEADSERST
jgi:trehalose 2-sulfotransferase